MLELNWPYFREHVLDTMTFVIDQFDDDVLIPSPKAYHI